MVKEGYNIVSGGAKGIDLKSSETALLAGAKSVIFVADSLLKYSVSGDLREYIQEGNLTLFRGSQLLKLQLRNTTSHRSVQVIVG